MKKLYSVAAASLLLLATACKKDEECHKAETIVGTWRASAVTCNPAINYNGTITTNLYPLFYGDPCKVDDIITFTDNNLMISDNGDVLCIPGSAQIDTGTYSLEGTTLTLVPPASPSPVSFINVKVENNNLYLNRPTIMDSTATYITFKFDRQ